MTDFHRAGCILAREHTGECLVPKSGKAIRAMRTGRPRPDDPSRREQTDERVIRRDGS